MELKLGDVQTTALIPLAVKANETVIISENELSTEMITAALDGSGYISDR